MLILGNWKAYIDTEARAKKLFIAVKKIAAKTEHEIVVAVPAPYLGLLASGNTSNVRFAAQDVSEVAGGAATGEVTAQMLADVGVSYVIVGHSERRARGETDERIITKVRAALASGLTPVLCVGERERDPDAQYLKIVRKQVSDVFSALSLKERLGMVIAYEPVWAIGKTAAEAATPNDVTEMVLYVRKVLGDFVVGKPAKKIRIIYGGSAEPGNVAELSATGVEGFLPGHASVDAAAFAALVKAAG